MHSQILTKKQEELLLLLKKFSNQFGLAGGTAIALHIGHRRSVDFDLFSNKTFDNFTINKKLKGRKIEKVFVDTKDEYTVLINKVKITFFYYPYKIKFIDNFEDYITMPDLLTLASLKAYALGRRAKWKDYVDLYFIMRDFFSINQITKKSKAIFSNSFNEKIFRARLSYFKDIDYSENINYMPGFHASEKDIKKGLKKFSLS